MTKGQFESLKPGDILVQASCHAWVVVETGGPGTPARLVLLGTDDTVYLKGCLNVDHAKLGWRVVTEPPRSWPMTELRKKHWRLV